MVRPGDWHPVSGEGELPSASLQHRTTIADSLNSSVLEDKSANQHDSSRQQYQLARSFCRFSVLVVSMVFIAEVLRRSDALRDRHADTTDYILREYYGEDSTEASLSRSWRRFLAGSITKVQQPHHSHHVIEEAHAALWPLTTSDWVGLVCVILGLMVAAGGGIGGGGILVPIFSLVMHFSPKHAIALSNVTVFGGSIANAMFNFSKRHPLADRPLIDWDLILVMEPLTIAGALIGAFLNKVLPELLLLVLLVILLSFTAYQSLEKGFQMYRKENKLLREQGLRPDGSKASELTKIVHNTEDENADEAEERLLDHVELQEGELSADGPLHDVNIEVPKVDPELQQILDEEKKVPMANVFLLCSMFFVVLTINVLKGGGAFPSPLGIKCGSRSFWFANAFMIGWILMISFLVRRYLVKRYEIKQRVGYHYVEGDIQWDSRATVVYPFICMFAGFFAGMFGVGGGIVKGPLMLAMGVHPAVSSATSACMILFTCFTATTSFVVFGLLVMDYAYVCVVIGFLATAAGQYGLAYLMQKNQRNSFIVFSIGGVVLLSAFLLTVQALVSMAEGERHGSGGICGKDS